MKNIILNKEGSIALLKINRPEVLNALNREVIHELAQVLNYIGNDKEIRVIVVTGEGNRAFVAGADIAELNALDVTGACQFIQEGQQVLRQLSETDKPFIAAVNGYAYGGGCELAMACDLRIAGENARFSLPEIKLGLIPGFGGTQRLPQIIGRARALEMLWTGRTVTASEALAIGLVNKVVPADQVLNKAMELAQEIAGKSSLAVANIKRAVYTANPWLIDEGLKFEAGCFGASFASASGKEGIKAFLEKRAAKFTDQG